MYDYYDGVIVFLFLFTLKISFESYEYIRFEN